MLLATLVVAALLAASCSDAHTLEEKERAEGATDPRVVTVFQPPELIPALKALAEAFSNDHPGVSFAFDDQPSKAQLTRIQQGATPALWIDQANIIDPYDEDPRAQAPLFDLGADVLQFVVQTGNPKHIDTLQVFGPNGGPYPTAHTGLCKNGTRCANASAKLLVANKVDATPTQRLDTLALAPAVADGTLDAALVYRTSAAPLGPKLTLVPLDPPTIGQVEFHMLRFTYSTSAAQFEAFLSTDAAQAIMLAQGLLPRVEEP